VPPEGIFSARATGERGQESFPRVGVYLALGNSISIGDYTGVRVAELSQLARTLAPCAVRGAPTRPPTAAAPERPPGAAGAAAHTARKKRDQPNDGEHDGDDEQPVHSEADAKRNDREKCKQNE
jgi:hypothetical protein